MPHPLNAFLASHPGLRQLSGKAKQIEALQRQYQRIAPASLQSGSRVLQLRAQVLIIAADNGAVAAKLRQMSTELLSLFQAMGCEITGIQIKVQVRHSPRIPSTPARSLGKPAQDALGKLRDELPDSPLRSALKRLVQRN